MQNREGYFDNHGAFRTPQAQITPHVIFDQKKFDELEELSDANYREQVDQAIRADSLSTLAVKIGAVPEILEGTITRFNESAKKQEDAEFHRAPESLTALDDKGPYYAIPMRTLLVNTQGGPKRNGKAEILDTTNTPIPHLYGAGELGSNVTRLYQGGEDLADCLIFGKIAGQNAAKAKEDQEAESTKLDASSSASQTDSSEGLESDIKDEEYETETNQFIGKSEAGMGNEIVVRVTVDKDKSIDKIEVLKQAESEDYGKEAVKELPEKMVAANTYDVDSVAGASLTSKGMKQAVKNALEQVE